jgi:hypothetical protein
MDPRIAPLAGQFEVATNLMRKALDGADTEVLLRRPGPDSNSMLWVAGHLTQFRCRIAHLLGSERPVPWKELFRTGSEKRAAADYPPIAEIAALWDDVSLELGRRMLELEAAELDAPLRVRMPSTDGTIAGALALFAFHEGYHIGQLGYLRRWHGLSPLLDG